jgi:hypothetical protein
VFPARYEPNSYIVFRKRLVSKRLIFTVAVLRTMKLRGAELLPHSNSELAGNWRKLLPSNWTRSERERACSPVSDVKARAIRGRVLCRSNVRRQKGMSVCFISQENLHRDRPHAETSVSDFWNYAARLEFRDGNFHPYEKKNCFFFYCGIHFTAHGQKKMRT